MTLIRSSRRSLGILLVLATALLVSMTVQAQETGRAGALVTVQPASRSPLISHALLLGAARAGSRIVAVGEGGTVALSDDDGKTFRRARSVPVQATLTSVFFADERQGWAVGHWGVIIHSTDGGESWTIQAQDGASDRPLYSVWFQDAHTGVAVGLWSKVLRTIDGGKTWNPVQLGAPESGAKADRNLFHLFADQQGSLFATAEGGWLMRSDDVGMNWRYIKTSYTGSLWTGIALRDGSLLLGGLRGTLLRSSDQGVTWSTLTLPIPRAITALTQSSDGVVYGAGLDGLWVRSDDGKIFNGQTLPNRPALTAIVLRKAGPPLLLSKVGTLLAP